MPRAKPDSVDDYLASVESEVARETLSALRQFIRSELPQAEEVISYGIPTYKQSGFVASFAAFKNHCSFFPGHTVQDFSQELKGYKTSKGTIQFPHDKPLPDKLVRSILRARVAENTRSRD